jgi:hypothetical protein
MLRRYACLDERRSKKLPRVSANAKIWTLASTGTCRRNWNPKRAIGTLRRKHTTSIKRASDPATFEVKRIRGFPLIPISGSDSAKE